MAVRGNSDRQNRVDLLSRTKPRQRGRDDLSLGVMATVLPENSHVCVCVYSAWTEVHTMRIGNAA